MIHQLNITKITKKQYKKGFWKDIKVFLKNKRGCDWYKNIPEDEKSKLVEQRKILKNEKKWDYNYKKFLF